MLIEPRQAPISYQDHRMLLLPLVGLTEVQRLENAVDKILAGERAEDEADLVCPASCFVPGLPHVIDRPLFRTRIARGGRGRSGASDQLFPERANPFASFRSVQRTL